MPKIINLDHFGRGIIKDNKKITFIENTLVGEDVDYEIIEEHKKYNIGKVLNFNSLSKSRVIAPCPYYESCGGCKVQHMSYEDTLEFKKNKVSEILKKYANLNLDIQTIANDTPYNYRNKISLKIINGDVGFYKSESHTLVKINKCLIAKKILNLFIKDIKYLNIKNGTITLRCNYNDELLIDIKTKENIAIDLEYLVNKYKLVGIVINDKIYYQEDKFIEKINNKLFQVSYNSFFQVNDNITSKIFNIVKENINENSIVVDMFCGVGTLGIVASKKAKMVYGIEIVPNAIKNALINKKINKVDNINFMLGDANKLVFKINDNIDTLIIDPPRAGLSKDGLESTLKLSPKNIIYISCDPMTLARDLKSLKDKYNITKFYIADMFSYTYHVECVAALYRRESKK